MRRGTTPTITITPSGIDLSTLDDIVVTVRQNKTILNFEPTITAEGNLAVTLTQEQTLRFKVGTVEVQFKASTTDGKVVASEISTVQMERVLNEVVI